MITLCSGGLRAELCQPGEYYCGTRFDHAGVFRRITQNGFVWADEWFDHQDAFRHDRVCGLSEEFVTVDFDGVEAGGRLEKPLYQRPAGPRRRGIPGSRGSRQLRLLRQSSQRRRPHPLRIQHPGRALPGRCQRFGGPPPHRPLVQSPGSLYGALPSAGPFPWPGGGMDFPLSFFTIIVCYIKHF